MTTKRYTKLAVGDLAYIYPSTKQHDGGAGIVKRVLVGQKGDEPHIEFQPPGRSGPRIMDYSKVGYGGKPPQNVEASATVNWLRDAATGLPPADLESNHME